MEKIRIEVPKFERNDFCFIIQTKNSHVDLFNGYFKKWSLNYLGIASNPVLSYTFDNVCKFDVHVCKFSESSEGMFFDFEDDTRLRFFCDRIEALDYFYSLLKEKFDIEAINKTNLLEQLKTFIRPIDPLA